MTAPLLALPRHPAPERDRCPTCGGACWSWGRCVAAVQRLAGWLPAESWWQDCGAPTPRGEAYLALDELLEQIRTQGRRGLDVRPLTDRALPAACVAYLRTTAQAGALDPTVEASGSATVRASGSATVRAFGSATVEASDSATVESSRYHSPSAVVALAALAAHIDRRDGKLVLRTVRGAGATHEEVEAVQP